VKGESALQKKASAQGDRTTATVNLKGMQHPKHLQPKTYNLQPLLQFHLLPALIQEYLLYRAISVERIIHGDG